MNNCPDQDIRLAYMHDLLPEVVAVENVATITQHLQSCTQCRLWLVAAQQLDAKLNHVMQHIVEPLPDLQPVVVAAISERRRQGWVWAGTLVVGMAMLLPAILLFAGVGIWQIGVADFMVAASRGLKHAFELMNAALVVGELLLPRLLPYAQVGVWLSLLILSPWLYRLALACDQRALAFKAMGKRLGIQEGVSL